MIENIHDSYRLIYNSNLTIKEAIDQIKFGIPMCKEVEYIIDFVSKSERGIIR